VDMGAFEKLVKRRFAEEQRKAEELSNSGFV
jgi:hypothetical protein